MFRDVGRVVLAIGLIVFALGAKGRPVLVIVDWLLRELSVRGLESIWTVARWGLVAIRSGFS